MTRSATLGVMIPTRNSASLLPAHLEALGSWIDLASEIVVVDSHSTDGTLEVLQQGLKGLPARFISHPPGLYASWNAGIQQLSASYTYISTVGDTILRGGIEQLLETATALDADAVLSKPVFKRPDGSEAAIHWPVDDIIQRLGVSAPRRLHRLEAVLFAATNPTAALTGSCASDVFRTKMMQALPFPTDFGTGGDGIWAMRNAPRVKWAVVPAKFSTFLLHSTAASQAENRPQAALARIDNVLREAGRAWIESGAVTVAEMDELRWNELMTALEGFLDAKSEFDECRRAKWPWVLTPRAWAARMRRETLGGRIEKLKSEALARLGRGLK